MKLTAIQRRNSPHPELLPEKPLRRSHPESVGILAAHPAPPNLESRNVERDGKDLAQLAGRARERLQQDRLGSNSEEFVQLGIDQGSS